MADNNYENLGFQVKVDGADSAVSNLDRIINRLERINQLQGKKISTSKQVINAQKKEEKQLKRNTQSLTSYIGKFTSATVLARKFAHIVTDAVNESAKYVENLNLFAVAFGDTYQQTLDWALDIADAYGLASNEVVRFAGVFRELSTSLGLVDKTADTVTKALTNYGYDLSALFNVSVEQAMEKLQSGIFSGNVRPLRAFGIDISQNQIDNLFKTNEALASMGVNARNLSQSDKVIARLVIALQSGTDAFGTMYREINNLQSQFRIFQGSLQNFKLAVGDLVQQPIADAMVYINAFIIAMTDIIRAFVPLKTIDETPVGNLGSEADEASQSLDNLNGKLADFDKFNVLGGQSSNNGQVSATEILNQLLEEQVALYDNKLTQAMENSTNQAKEFAEQIRNWFIEIDENGNFVKWSENVENIIDQLKLLGTTLIILATGKGTIGLMKWVQDFTLNLEKMKANTQLVEQGLGTLTIEAELNAQKMQVVAQSFNMAVIGISALVSGIITLSQNWDKMNEGERTATIFWSIAAAIGAATAAIHLFKGNWAMALGVAGIVAGAGLTIGSIGSQLDGFADGGYSNANLIMTHENGKREWVGKAAGSNAIVNDTQMSDIMEVAVAKGVYNALSARSAMGNNVPTNETIVVKIGEEAVFNAVRKTARRQGKDFATV